MWLECIYLIQDNERSHYRGCRCKDIGSTYVRYQERMGMITNSLFSLPKPTTMIPYTGGVATAEELKASIDTACLVRKLCVF